MIRACLLALTATLSPLIAVAQDTPERMISLVEQHCTTPYPGLAAYDLPSGWHQAPVAQALAATVNLAVEEGIGYGDFAIAQSGAPLSDPTDTWYTRTLAEFEQEFDSQRGYTLSDWQRLFVHGASGTHLFISANLFLDETNEPDPLDWDQTNCWLWHPDRGHALGAAIGARWDLPFGNRLSNPLGHLTRHYAYLDVAGKKFELQTTVIRPTTELAPALADTILRFRLNE